MSPTGSLSAVIVDIDNHIRKGGGGYAAWYCGIAATPRDRLFSDHNVAAGGWWIVRDCGTEAGARAVERHFHAKGCRGGGGGGDCRTCYVYKITATTDEAA
jgi:hypothetical protein